MQTVWQPLKAVSYTHLDVYKRQTSEYVSSATDEEAVFGEKVKEFAERIGISVRGEYDESGQFHVGYYFPYFKAKNATLKDEVTIEKQSDRDAYAGICDNVKVGVSLIFQLLNMADFIDYTEFHKGSLFYAPMYLTCLLYTSFDMRILFAVINQFCFNRRINGYIVFYGIFYVF